MGIQRRNASRCRRRINPSIYLLLKPEASSLLEANAALRRLRHNDTPLRIKPIPLDKLKLITFAASSLANQPGGTAEVGYVVAAAHDDIFKGQMSDISILVYRNRKIVKAASSTLLTEANAMLEALSRAVWISTWLGLVKRHPIRH